MKNKLRNITINSQPFVYWLSGGECLHLNISPKENKNIKIMIIFKSEIHKNPLQSGRWTFYELLAYKNNTKTSIFLTKPKGISEIISFLVINKKDLFIDNQHHTIRNGLGLLNEMGYVDIQPVWEVVW